MLKKLKGLLVLFFSISIILNFSGCFDYEQEITLNEDGSGEITLHYIVGEEMMSMMEGSDEPIIPDKETIEQDYIGEGIELKDFHTEELDTEQHWYITLTFDDLNSLSRLEGFEGQKLTFEDVGDSFSFENSFASSEGDMGMEDLTEEEIEQQKQLMKTMFAGYEFTFVVNMPDEIVTTNADETTGSMAKWVYPLTDLIDIDEFTMKAECLK